jgi:hypothetical protein
MILRELFYFDKETIEPVENDRYEPENDTSPVNYDDTRKTRLTLRQTGIKKNLIKLLFVNRLNPRSTDRLHLL